MQISQWALHRSFPDLTGSADLRELENKIQRYCMDFARDFMRCTCKEAPYYVCPARKISLRIPELRMEGKSLAEIIDDLSEKYRMHACQRDPINRLDLIVRCLEEIEAVARVRGKMQATEEKRQVEGV